MSVTSLKTCLSALLLWLAGASAWAAPGLTIGVSVSDLGNPFFIQIARGAEARARQLAGDDVRVSVVSSAYYLQRQVGQIDQFIQQKVDMILLSAADENAIEAAVQRAKSAGIKVLAVDVNARGADVTVTTDNAQAGRIACAYLARRLGGSGKVVIINGPPVSSVLERVSGCKRELARFPAIELLSDSLNGGGSRQGGMEKMIYLLTAFPDIDAVFTINDQIAAGAEDAARLAGRTDFIIVGVDGAPLALERLRQGDSLVQGTAAQFPRRMAETAVELGLQLMGGESIAPSTVRIPATMITRDNVADFKNW